MPRQASEGPQSPSGLEMSRRVERDGPFHSVPVQAVVSSRRAFSGQPWDKLPLWSAVLTGIVTGQDRDCRNSSAPGAVSPNEKSPPLAASGSELVNGEKLPRRFGRYTILAVVGEGGMARVYQAELQGPAGFRKQVCLKVLKSETTEATEETGTGESLFLIREACIVGRLKHPNIVDVYELGEVDGELFISMELVEGLTLARIIGPGRRLPGAVVMEIAVAIATGLAKAHGLVSDGRPAGLVHCDLKPSNILISWDGAVKIADFGIATTQHDEAGQSMELPEGLRGTPSFMSPEQVLGDELDGRSDLFSLALVLATTALGNNPLGGQYVFRQVLSGEPLRSPLLSEEVVSSLDEVAPGLGEVLVRCLLSDREDRYLDAEYLIRAL